ncbi:hypothetical protein [Actinacidiphila acidipaludis]|uniref:Secreted protein n=1 Tax=Actinacidiphila acidipaludis TaxID=2873382 RepID=A0ABS7Q1E3_9ACTN|nr:hypothetical protein [Streptomyces acidipaludis]MBY8876943.1 hypothetical protein [Streptomyces acidipaludis]
MGALVWLLIPVVAVALAAVWARWAARRRVTRDGASLAGYERFRAAMETVPGASDRPAAGPSEANAAAGEEGHTAEGASEGRAADGSGRPAPAPAGRRRRIIPSGHGGKRAHASRTASAQTAADGGGED